MPMVVGFAYSSARWRSGERMRLVCWRTRPRGRELCLARFPQTKLRDPRKDCFGATPKPARGTRALPGSVGRWP